jgi:hypothetical protein
MKTTVNTARRGFLWKASAALAAPLAVGAASARAHATAERDAPHARLAELEDVNAIRELTRRYVRHVNAGAHDEAAALFSEPAHADTRAARSLAADPLGGVDAIEIAASGTAATAACCVARSAACSRVRTRSAAAPGRSSGSRSAQVRPICFLRGRQRPRCPRLSHNSKWSPR